MARFFPLLLFVVLIACSVDDGITVTPLVTTATSTLRPSSVEPGSGQADSPPLAAPQDLPPVTAVTTITLAPILTTGLTDATYLTHPGDERLFIVEKTARIRIIQDGSLLPTPFLDISERVESDFSERGLLSVAFHPNYGENGSLFVNYTNNDGLQSVLIQNVTFITQ